MSVTIDIGCRKCKERLWIGQDREIYLGEPQTMEDLSNFIGIHCYHGEAVVVSAGDGELADEFCSYTDFRDNRRKPKNHWDELLDALEAKKKAAKKTGNKGKSKEVKAAKGKAKKAEKTIKTLSLRKKVNAPVSRFEKDFLF